MHRHHTGVLRIEPAFRFNKQASLRLGLAGEHTYLDFTSRTGLEPQHVYRVAADLSLAYGPVRAFGEYIGQFGKTVTDYPFPRKPATTTPAEPGRSSGRNHYVMAGAEAEARKNNWSVVIAILDSGGQLVMLQRLDNTQWGSIEVAKDKARSAVAFRRPTKVFSDLIAQGVIFAPLDEALGLAPSDRHREGAAGG